MNDKTQSIDMIELQMPLNGVFNLPWRLQMLVHAFLFCSTLIGRSSPIEGNNITLNFLFPTYLLTLLNWFKTRAKLLSSWKKIILIISDNCYFIIISFPRYKEDRILRTEDSILFCLGTHTLLNRLRSFKMLFIVIMLIFSMTKVNWSI